MSLINRLPKSYDELNHKIYFDIINTLPSEKPDWIEDDEEWGSYIQFSILSKLLNIPVIDLERLPVTEIIPLMNGIAYFNNEPQPSKTSLKVKVIDSLTYDEFVNYQKLMPNHLNHVTEIMKLVVANRSEQEIESMSVSEVYEGFFMLQTSTKKSLRTFQISLAKRLVKMSLKQIWRMILKLFSRSH
ncbi:hypothetical protein FPZ42_07710 [Mucilaginibacter achroorhodeus]|uniref:Uncharacterized protein n=1 Tax=Mucilaginibacter achroorhodeus TaxID=2599294 RepID=A0A563U6D6_9SPHI|nr:hypothetical protein [Mucilaginibacter achroorhodeus]TWR26912.1 hypothetical protein FPZ42_07710 [Mucilaginibacter achroorhodeus]